MQPRHTVSSSGVVGDRHLPNPPRGQSQAHITTMLFRKHVLDGRPVTKQCLTVAEHGSSAAGPPSRSSTFRYAAPRSLRLGSDAHSMLIEHYDLTEPGFESPTNVVQRRSHQPGSPGRRSSWPHTRRTDCRNLERFCACMQLCCAAFVRSQHREPSTILG